jgi:hypothetical protein
MTNLKHWDIADDFTAQQVAALVQGVEPSQAESFDVANSPIYGPMKRCYEARRRWLQLNADEAVNWADLGIEKAEQMLESVEMSQRLTHPDGVDEDGVYRENLIYWLTAEAASDFAGQRFSPSELARWLSAMKFKSEYKFLASKPTEAETPLSTKERSSMLKILLAMAVDGYGYVPSDKKSTVTSEIEAAVNGMGLSIDPGTVRKYLREAKSKYWEPSEKLPDPKSST